MNLSLVGRTYGPFTYEAGAEKIREFAYAIHGGAPSSIYPGPPPEGTPRAYYESDAPVAPPTFCVNFAIKPFVACTLDPELGLNLLLLVHGEQSFEFLAPVRAGDLLKTVGTVSELYEKSGKDFVIVTTVTTNQHSREVVRGVWTAVVRK